MENTPPLPGLIQLWVMTAIGVTSIVILHFYMSEQDKLEKGVVEKNKLDWYPKMLYCIYVVGVIVTLCLIIFLTSKKRSSRTEVATIKGR